MTEVMAPALTVRRRAGLAVATVVVANRALLSFLRTPQLVVLGTAQLAGFMVTFRYLLGGAIGITHGLSYVDYAVPGFIAAGVPFTLIGTSVAVAADLDGGFIDRMRSLPAPRASVLTGRVLADAAVLVWSLGIGIAVGFAIGFRLHGSVLAGLAAFGLCLVYGVAFSWIFILLGLLAGNAQAAQGMAMLVFPLAFGSSAYISVTTMPGWLRAFADNQPITPMADAVRALTLGPDATAMLGHSSGYYVIHALVWTAVILVIFCPLAIARYRST
jgi:ABC-2 type transport system permease protein